MGFKRVFMLWGLCVFGVSGQGLAQQVDSIIEGKESSKSSPKAQADSTYDEDRVEIIDYKRNKILGFMIVRNGHIIRRMVYKEPRNLESQPSLAPNIPPKAGSSIPPAPSQDRAQSPNAPSPTPTPKTPTPKQEALPQNLYERQISNAPKDTKSPKQSHSHKGEIPQEIGVESTRVNPIYKNRQWEKRHIIHDISQEVIELER
ncbi:hypothetical protein [Helicobacter canis]|uniref:Periplasmic protein n=1 Tax=Helicobacter canis TaxID=29419 RepID=A0A377J602_9HELI|nr:hypothetical protein [Helicobacter canis]STO97223.1 Uncharacterised protein [Helicobacter canis]